MLTATVRPATAGDLTAVAEIFGHYVRESVVTFEETPPSVDDWSLRLDDLSHRGLPFLVASVDGTVAGYAYTAPWRPKPAYRHTVENTVYVDPRFTGRGLGRALLGELLARCAEAGARQVVAVVVDGDSGASQALHRALGFTEAGRLTAVGFKHGRWLDTMLMQHTLSPE